MKDRKPFLALHGAQHSLGHMLYIVWRGGRVVDKIQHYPWFVADRPVRGGPVVDVVKLDGYMLKYGYGHVYTAEKPVYKILVENKKQVPDLAKKLVAMNGRVGMYNIVYEVRAGFDIQEEGYGILGYPTPLAFLPNTEMVSLMEDVIATIGDLKVMAVDIEVYSKRGGFPAKGDPLLSITYSIFSLKDNIFSATWPEENVQYIINESADTTSSFSIVKKFIDIVKRERPDIIVTYNGSGFDFPYMAPFSSITFHPEFLIFEKDDVYIPHIDLMIVRDRLGSSLGLRSQAVYALDDVALEVAKQVAKYYDINWLFNSRYIEAERKLDHAKLREYFARGDELVYNYIVADVYLTSLLARVWLYPILLLSTLTGIPINVLQRLNVGQMAEYVFTELLRRLGLYPELRTREWHYSRLSGYARVRTITNEKRPIDVVAERVESFDVFTKGKVYVKTYGVFGGNGKKIVELDFAQLYPTDMVVNTVDPTSLFILDGIEYDQDTNKLDTIKATLKVNGDVNLRIVERATWTLTKSKNIYRFYKIVPGYGPIAWFIYKLYTARWETKKLKKKAKKEKRIELEAPDQAVKIYNNSGYGSFSKTRGNLVHELISASVFWRTQRLLYEVIDAIENVVSERLGRKLTVLYGDTDSTYILVDEDVPGEKIAELVNEWIAERYGPLYKMELEDEYSVMYIPKRKGEDSPSAKSYILLDRNGKVVKLKGEFFKMPLPLAIKERLTEFYEELIRRRASSKDVIAKIIKEFVRGEPAYKFFIKKSVSSFVSEDDPARFKNLNKPFHFAALVSLCEQKSPGATVKERTTDTAGWKRIRCEVDPRIVEETQRAVIVMYLPHINRNSKMFIIYKGEENGRVYFYDVTVTNVTVTKRGINEKSKIDDKIIIEYKIKIRDPSRDAFIDRELIKRIHREVISTLYEKFSKSLLSGRVL